MLHVLGSFVGGKLETKDAKLGSDHRLEVGGRLRQCGSHWSEHQREKIGTHRFHIKCT